MMKRLFYLALTLVVGMSGTWTTAFAEDCGPVLDLNGTDQCVLSAADNDVDMSKNFTVQAWVKPAADFTGGPFIAVREMWFWITADGRLEFSGWYAHGAQAEFWVTDSVGVVPKDEWSHVTIVEDDNLDIYFYINGVLSSVNTTLTDTNWFHDPAYPCEYGWGVGARPYPESGGGPMYFFKGQIAEARMWGRPLSAQEIADQYLYPLNGDESNLVRYYKLDEGTGETANDSSTFNVDGTVRNAPAWAEACFPWFTGPVPTPTPLPPPSTGVESDWSLYQ